MKCKKKMAAAVCVLSMFSAGMVSAGEEMPLTLPLDADSAQQMALLDAGAEQDEAERLRVKAEREDREDVFEVEFYCQDAEYEYTIRREDGMILEWQIEGRNVGDLTAEASLARAETADEEKEKPDDDTAGIATADGTELIGLESAKKIVTDDCGGAEDITFTKLHFEYEGRFYEYEFEVYAGNREYEYTIDAQTGEILQAEFD